MAAAMCGRRGSIARGIWYWIKAARMPGMTFTQTSPRQGTAAQGAMPLDRFGGVFGAARIKAAILSQERADRQLVHAQQQ
jgi:hypothetical protein